MQSGVRTMVDSLARVARALVIAGLCMWVAACASQAKRNEADLAEMADWLPGRYDTGTGLELTIVRVRVPRISDHVFYVQEVENSSGRRLVGQRLWSLDAVPDGEGVLHRIWSLKEPGRWLEGVRNPDLFVSVMPPDFEQMGGCDLLWKREGEKFVGANDPKACRVSSASTGGLVRWSLRAELGPTDLAIADEAFDLAGRRVQGRDGDPFHRFEKR